MAPRFRPAELVTSLCTIPIAIVASGSIPGATPLALGLALAVISYVRSADPRRSAASSR